MVLCTGITITKGILQFFSYYIIHLKQKTLKSPDDLALASEIYSSNVGYS